MTNKKYQIFISSTYKDLQEQRKKIIYAILNMGHLPSGMELFTAASEEQFEYIKKVIDDSDYYVLILGQCYGTISHKTGKSYTEMEYEYACSKKIPILVFLSDENLELKSMDENLNRIKKFRERVLNDNRLAKFWGSNEELIQNIIISLNYNMLNFPRVGWIRTEIEQIENEEKIRNLNQDYIIDYYPQIEPNPSTRNNDWYEKYKSGKIRQGGVLYLDSNDTYLERQIYLLQGYKTNNYFFMYSITNPNEDSCVEISVKEKNEKFIVFRIRHYRKKDKTIVINWLAEGF